MKEKNKQIEIEREKERGREWVNVSVELNKHIRRQLIEFLASSTFKNLKIKANKCMQHNHMHSCKECSNKEI